MKIELLIRRAAGSTVEMDGVIYRFNDANDHTCEVENEDHAHRLLEQEPIVFVVADQVEGDVDHDPAAAVNKEAAKVPAKASRKPRAPKATKE